MLVVSSTDSALPFYVAGFEPTSGLWETLGSGSWPQRSTHLASSTRPQPRDHWQPHRPVLRLHLSTGCFLRPVAWRPWWRWAIFCRKIVELKFLFPKETLHRQEWEGRGWGPGLSGNVQLNKKFGKETKILLGIRYANRTVLCSYCISQLLHANSGICIFFKEFKAYKNIKCSDLIVFRFDMFLNIC